MVICGTLLSFRNPVIFLYVFQTFESLLSCAICYDFFNIAVMIPQCSHNCKYGNVFVRVCRRGISM
uniref:Uncharacterized protein n=1 Tax=Ornithorhynchus anatinus TaxID=9258 RepID=A0A6I8NG85_ORNAN